MKHLHDKRKKSWKNPFDVVNYWFVFNFWYSKRILQKSLQTTQHLFQFKWQKILAKFNKNFPIVFEEFSVEQAKQVESSFIFGPNLHRQSLLTYNLI